MIHATTREYTDLFVPSESDEEEQFLSVVRPTDDLLPLSFFGGAGVYVARNALCVAREKKQAYRVAMRWDYDLAKWALRQDGVFPHMFTARDFLGGNVERRVLGEAMSEFKNSLVSITEDSLHALTSPNRGTAEFALATHNVLAAVLVSREADEKWQTTARNECFRLFMSLINEEGDLGIDDIVFPAWLK